MTFDPAMFEGFIASRSAVFDRVTPSYAGEGTEFDIVIVGSGMGGGLLADDLADRLKSTKRILVVEAGSYLFPTHVYNLSRMPNAAVAGKFGCRTFTQGSGGDGPNYIHELPQLNLGGRSVFWSGLIPAIQPWELEFFPPRVRQDLAAGLLHAAGETMNVSVSLGTMARRIVGKLQAGALADDFTIEETPRALHQPYLQPDGAPTMEHVEESTGVFNTAELLINQLGLKGGDDDRDPSGLALLLNHYVEDVRRLGDGRLEIVARDVLTGGARSFQSGKVVLAAGSIESPKLLARSSVGRDLPPAVAGLVGRGLTDHPTTNELGTAATNIGEVEIPKNAVAKIVFYSKGRRDEDGSIRYPFNVEMNVNHEYWHLRENDPSSPATPITATGASIVDIKFSFGNCLDPANEIRPAPPFGYVPEIVFRNQGWTSHLCGSRFPALAGWRKSDGEVFAVLNEVAHRIFSQFECFGAPCRPEKEVWYGQGGKGFGWGTVHHAAGSLRMPYRERLDAPFSFDCVVDEDLQVVGAPGLYVCDMSVMPFASAANPVRTLAALALRLSPRLG